MFCDSNMAIERGSLKFPNRNSSVSISNNLLKKIDHTINKAAVLENLYFQQCNLNVNKIDVVTYFSKLICHFLLICFQLHMTNISAKSDKFFLSYSNLFGVQFFFQTQCTCMRSNCTV